jgi:hypothetical protein
MGLLTAVVLVVVLGFAGCASVLPGSSDRFQVTSTPSGAEVKASTGETCFTPCSLPLDRGGDFMVVVSKRGFKSERFAVGENCASTIDLALRPIAGITASELPDRDLPLVVGCDRRTGGRPRATDQPTGLPPVH